VSRPATRTRRKGVSTDARTHAPAANLTGEASTSSEDSTNQVPSSGTEPRARAPRRERRAAECVLVLDPGFRSLTGHHFNNNIALMEAGDARNTTFRILAGNTCANVGKLQSITTPHFATDLYEGAAHFQESWEFDSWLHVNAKFRKDLNAISGENLDWANLILVPAITQFHMLALAQWLAGALESRPHLRAVVQLMFSPTWTAWDAICTSGEQMYADAFAYLAPYEGKRVFYCSELQASCREFEPLLTTPVTVLPHPGIWRPPANQLAPAQRSVTRIGYFGYAKREKGFHLLPEIVREIRRLHGTNDVHLLLQVNHGGYDPSIVKAAADLELLVDSGIRLLRGSMSNSDYLNAFESADILLLPYDPELYRGRGSGVFSEAIGYGKVVVAPQSAGVGEEIEAGNGAGVLFRDYDAAAVAAAVNEAVRRAPELTSLAMRSAERWREKHSGPGYLSVVDELIA
jgi:glycosyltransferase involved in cell wall biosynthesis